MSFSVLISLWGTGLFLAGETRENCAAVRNGEVEDQQRPGKKKKKKRSGFWSGAEDEE